MRPDVFQDMNITFRYFVCLKKISVNSNVLSFNLKLFLTKVGIKCVVRNCWPKTFVVNVQSLETCKLSKYSIEISVAMRSHSGSLATNCLKADARYVNS